MSPAESWTKMEDPAMRGLLMSVFAWVADKERENISERTKIGIERARREGKTIGRPEKIIPWDDVDELKDKGINLTSI